MELPRQRLHSELATVSRRKLIGGIAGGAVALLLSACSQQAATPTAAPAPATAAPSGSSAPTAAPAAPTSAAQPTVAPAATAAPAAAGSVEIVWMWWGTDTGATSREQERVDLFKKKFPNSPIKLTTRNIPSKGYKDQLLTQLAGGVGPDVFRLSNSWVFQFVEQQQVAALDSLLSSTSDAWITRKDLKKAFIDSARYGGKLYGVPMGTDMSSIFLNLSLFQKANVPAPPKDYKDADYDSNWSTDSVLESAKKLTARSGNGPADSFGIDVSNFDGHLWALVESMGGKTLSDDWTTFLWDQEPAASALQWMADLGLKQKVAPTQVESKSGAFGFPNGRLAMSWTYVSQLSYRTKDVQKKFDWDQAPWLHGPGNKPVVSYWYGEWCLNAHSKHQDEAFTWLNFVSGPDGSLPGVQLGWELPLFSDLDPQYNSRIKEWNKNVLPALDGLDYAGRMYYLQPSWDEMWTTVVGPAIDEIFAGKKTAAQAMKEVVPDANKLLQAGAKLMGNVK